MLKIHKEIALIRFPLRFVFNRAGKRFHIGVATEFITSDKQVIVLPNSDNTFFSF